jgi:exodeoxyribonuclease VII small subunit
VTEPDVGYADAMAELERILAELEGDHLDVDVLAERVRRASELIKLCRSRIARAQDDVAKIVTDLEAFELELDHPDGDTADPAVDHGDGELF